MGARNRIVTALKSIPRLVRGRILPVLASLLICLLVVFLAVGGFDNPTWVDRFFGPAEKFRVLEFLGVAMGGVLLAIGAVIAHKRAVALEDAAKAQARAAEAQADAAKRQAEANKGAEDGRRQERLKNAIEHLGHDSDSVRLGGAYELFHLAKDTEDLRQTVLDILCAHIRRTTGEAEYRKEHRAKPSEEIQSLLTLLFVREYAFFEGCRVDLQGSWLDGAMLMDARLQRASFIGARLQGAILIEAYLQGADLTEANLRGVDLSGAHLQGTDLTEANLQGANCSGAYMPGARLCWAQMQGANFFACYLQGANFFSAQMQRASLVLTQMQGAGFSKTQMQGSTNHQATMSSFESRIRAGIGQESDLSGATFSGGFNRHDMDSLVEGFPDKNREKLWRILAPHIGRSASHAPPENAITGAYTAEEAERWIAEYEEAMRGGPEAGEG